MYISQEDLNRKVEKFMQREPKTMVSYLEMHFEGKLIRYPIETRDNKVVEATFCYGYKREQYLVAVSPQIGCASKCKFCELGDYGLIRNLKDDEILDQINIVLKKAYEKNYPIFDRPIKLTFVMGGEPLANKYFGKAFERVKDEIPLKTKVSTIFPNSKSAKQTYRTIVEVAKEYPNPVQFQVSLNSTDEAYRQSLASIPLANFSEIRKAAEHWFSEVPNPRKIDLTFTVSEETPLDPKDISDVLTPDMVAIRLRPWVATERGKENGLEELMDGKLEDLKKKFEDAGYFYVPGAAGGVEYRFKLAPGESIKLYSKIRNQKLKNSQKKSSGGK